MTILTQTMVTERKDYAGDNLKLFFPFNEGEGTLFTDIIGGVSFSESGALHTVPHAVTLATGVISGSPVSTGTIPKVKSGESLIIVAAHKVNVGSNFNAIGFGSTVSGKIGISLTNVVNFNNGGFNTSAAMSVGTAGQTHLRAGTFNGVTGELRGYEGLNGGSVANTGTADASAHLGAIDFPDTIIVGDNNSFNPDVYGFAFFTVNILPAEADLLSYLDTMYSSWTRGHKITDSRLSGY